MKGYAPPRPSQQLGNELVAGCRGGAEGVEGTFGAPAASEENIFKRGGEAMTVLAFPEVQGAWLPERLSAAVRGRRSAVLGRRSAVLRTHRAFVCGRLFHPRRSEKLASPALGCRPYLLLRQFLD